MLVLYSDDGGYVDGYVTLIYIKAGMVMGVWHATYCITRHSAYDLWFWVIRDGYGDGV
jgi:hypothetical protein